MTSIRHYPDPRIVKLDGRFKFYPKFGYRVDFNTQTSDGWMRWMNVCRWCERTWGDECHWSLTKPKPKEYRTEISKKNKYYRHVYLRTEEDITMLLLVIGG